MRSIKFFDLVELNIFFRAGDPTVKTGNGLIIYEKSDNYVEIRTIGASDCVIYHHFYPIQL